MWESQSRFNGKLKSHRPLEFTFARILSSNSVEGGCLCQILHLYDRGIMYMILTKSWLSVECVASRFVQESIWPRSGNSMLGPKGDKIFWLRNSKSSELQVVMVLPFSNRPKETCFYGFSWGRLTSSSFPNHGRWTWSTYWFWSHVSCRSKGFSISSLIVGSMSWSTLWRSPTSREHNCHNSKSP